MNLYQINAEIQQLENACEDGLLIDAETGELLTFADALEQLHMAREKKIENVALWIKNLTADTVAIKAEEESLAKRRGAEEAKIDRLKDYLLSALMRDDGTIEKFHTARCAISIRKNPVRVAISDEAAIPNEFFTETVLRKADKAQLKEVLARGIEVPGARLEQTRSVTIK